MALLFSVLNHLLILIISGRWCLLTFFSQMQRLFKGCAYSRKCSASIFKRGGSLALFLSPANDHQKWLEWQLSRPCTRPLMRSDMKWDMERSSEKEDLLSSTLGERIQILCVLCYQEVVFYLLS